MSTYMNKALSIICLLLVSCASRQDLRKQMDHAKRYEELKAASWEAYRTDQKFEKIYDVDQGRLFEEYFATAEKYRKDFMPLCDDGDKYICECISSYAGRLDQKKEEYAKDREKLLNRRAEIQSELDEAKAKKDAENAERDTQRAKYQELGGDEFYEACVSHEGIERAKRSIENQNAIGREVGVVDQAALHREGSLLVAFKKSYPEKIAAYEKKMKKKFNPKQCSERVSKSVTW